MLDNARPFARQRLCCIRTFARNTLTEKADIHVIYVGHRSALFPRGYG